MDSYKKIVEEPLFFKWIFNSNPEIDKYWEDYLAVHPEETETLETLKIQLEKIKYPVDCLTDEEKKKMSSDIIEQLELNHKKKPARKIIIRFMRYAAGLLLILGIGGIIVYSLTKKDKIPADLTVQVPAADTIDKPVLILSQGKNIELKNSNSTVDYTHSGLILLNRDSLIQIGEEHKEPEINQLIIPYGNRSVITLSDNTVVTLNAGSRLIFPSFFNGKTREVSLYGEAYFIVSKNKKIPFVVKTISLDVTVLGTEFNVSAYTDENIIQTVLKEGSVSVRRNNTGSSEEEILLKPSQMAVFDKTAGKTDISEVDVDAYTIWTKGMLSFDQIDFSRIIKKVERYYNIRIEYENPMAGTIKISGKLDLAREKEEVFEYLSKVSASRIEKINDLNYIIR